MGKKLIHIADKIQKLVEGFATTEDRYRLRDVEKNSEQFNIYVCPSCGTKNLVWGQGVPISYRKCGEDLEEEI